MSNAPTIAEFEAETDRHSKRRHGKKPFVVESRFTRGALSRGWRVYGRYATAKQAGQAYEQLQKNRNNGFEGGPFMEFRIPQ